jgi:ferric-chelate reductase
MSTGTPWLDQPVMLHSSREDNCTLTDAQCRYRNYSWRYWYGSLTIYTGDDANQIRYQADHVYALNTIYFMCAVIGIFTISNLLVRLAPDRVKRTRPWRMFTSVSRYFSYRGYRSPALRYWSPALGVVILGVLGAAFFFGGFNHKIWNYGLAADCP